jgi:hypothetical protein
MAVREEERLNAAVEWQLEREEEEDEWYVDALAVFTNWGRKGQYRLNRWKRSFESDLLRKNHHLVCRKETPHAL